MPLSESDPRVYFAAERTLLAWLRTGLTIIAIGFVIARFGLFMQLLHAQAGGPVARESVAGLLGVAFVLTGTVAIVAATVQHRRYVSTLPAADLPPGYSGVATALSAVIALLGCVLGAYLLVAR